MCMFFNSDIPIQTTCWYVMRCAKWRPKINQKLSAYFPSFSLSIPKLVQWKASIKQSERCPLCCTVLYFAVLCSAVLCSDSMWWERKREKKKKKCCELRVGARKSVGANRCGISMSTVSLHLRLCGDRHVLVRTNACQYGTTHSLACSLTHSLNCSLSLESGFSFTNMRTVFCVNI